MLTPEDPWPFHRPDAIQSLVDVRHLDEAEDPHG